MVISMAHLSVLDGVRAVAVLLVVVCHLLLQVIGGDPAYYSIHAMGHLGVAIFFVHTTLVLMGSLARNGSAVIPFYVRRLFRIYPLAITVVLFIALLQLAGSSPIDVGRLLSNVFLVQNLTGDQPYIGPLWSLPYEVQMYLVLPLLYAVITRTKRPVLWCATLYVGTVVIAASDAGNLAHFHVPTVTAPLIRFAPCFTAGALAYALSGRMPKVLHPAWVATVLAAGIALVPCLVGIGAPETPLMWALCLLLAIVIPASREVAYQPLARATKTIATYSYGVYLTHVFALGAIDGLMPGPAIVQWAAMLILLPGLAYICYHGIEKRGLALGMRLAARLERSERKNLGGAPAGDQAGSL
jgi:peptidoglycan/LPS O-acetylase OafA/YrhL